MRLPKALITFRTKDGADVKREPVEVMFTRGEPHPRDRVICIDLPDEGDGKLNRSVFIGVKTLERACGFKIKILK